MDNAASMRGIYGRISAGDLARFGDGPADDFALSQRAAIERNLQSSKTTHRAERKKYDDDRMLRLEGMREDAPMPVPDAAREFVLTLRHRADGGPCGALRVLGQQGETAFEGWIELIGLITEARGATVDNAGTMRRAYERISAGDISGFGDLVADDFVEHDEIPGLPPTKDGMLDYFRLLLSAFPDLRLEVEDLIGDGDKTVARVRATATHDGEFMGVPPTGEQVQIQLIDIMRFDDDGLVCEHWGVADMLSLMQQLGVAPA